MYLIAASTKIFAFRIFACDSMSADRILMKINNFIHQHLTVLLSLCHVHVNGECKKVFGYDIQITVIQQVISNTVKWVWFDNHEEFLKTENIQSKFLVTCCPKGIYSGKFQYRKQASYSFIIYIKPYDKVHITMKWIKLGSTTHLDYIIVTSSILAYQGWHDIVATLPTVFPNAFCWMKISTFSFKFCWKLFPRSTWQYVDPRLWCHMVSPGCRLNIEMSHQFRDSLYKDKSQDHLIFIMAISTSV